MITTQKQVLENSIIATIVKYPSLFFDNEKDLDVSKFSDDNQKLASYIFEKIGLGEKLNPVRIAEDCNIPYKFIKGLDSLINTEDFQANVDSFIDKHRIESITGLISDLQIDFKNGVTGLEAIGSINEMVDELSSVTGNDKDYHISSSINDTVDRIIKAKENEGLTGMDTGLEELNKFTGGWHRGRQIVIAGRPGMGKTTYVLDRIKTLCKNGKKCIIFNLEMTTHEVILNLLALETGVSNFKLRTGDLTQIEVNLLLAAAPIISTWSLWIYDSIVDIDKICQETRIMNRKHDIDIVAVDYLQLCATKLKGNREVQVSDMSRKLKLIGKPEDCDCGTVVLSQLNRSVESRGGEKRPIMSDLRESGSIEQDADEINFLYRPDYYGIEMGDMGAAADLTELIIPKNRGGITGTVEMKYTAKGYVDYSDSGFTEPKPFDNPSEGIKPNYTEDIPF